MFAKGSHILIVDDSFNIRRIITDSLRKIGFSRMVTADDATEGFNKLSQQAGTPDPFDIVLSDLNMPGPSGLDFLRQVRADERFTSLPFVLITTESEKGAVIEAAVSGVSSYIVKPFNIETLTMRLKEAYTKHNPNG